MRALTKRRMAGGLLASAAVSGALAIVGVPAYGQSAGVGNSGQASASTGGNSSTGNASTNVAENTATSPTTAPPSVIGGLLGVVLNLSTQSTNQSNGSSTIGTGAAQASGNNADNAVGQTAVGGGGGILGTVFSPFVTPTQSAGVSNSGDADASTGGNSGTGNASTNVATNNQNVSAGLIAVGITLGSTASNVSNGTSVINTGPASAAGNTATNAVDQERIGGGGIGGGLLGSGGKLGIGSGVACDGRFGFGGQRVNVDNAGSARASTGNNTSVGNESTNSATNNIVTGGDGLINLDIPGLLGINSANVSDGSSVIGTGAASASGNQSTTAVTQDCVQPVAFHGPPVITPPVVRLGQPVVPVVHQQQQLARTGVDPFVLGLVAFALLFGGFLFMVWERVEAIPAGGRTPTA